MKLRRKLPKQYIYSPYLEFHFGPDPNRLSGPQKYILKRKGTIYVTYCEHINKIHRNRISKKKLILKIFRVIKFLNHGYYTDYGSFRMKNNFYFFYLNIFGNVGCKYHLEISSFSKNKILDLKRFFLKNNTEREPIIRPNDLNSYKNKNKINKMVFNV